MSYTVYSSIICLIILIYSAYEDIIKGTVNSKLILIMTGIGAILNLTRLNDVGISTYLLRYLFVALIFYFYEGFLGGGDAKLLMMIIMWSGVQTVLYTLILALTLSIIVEMLRNKKHMIEILKWNFYAVVSRDKSILKQDPTNTTRIRFVPYMLIGYLFAITLQMLI